MSLFLVGLSFDNKVIPEAQQFADANGIKIFNDDVIYHLFDSFIEYKKLCVLERKKAKEKEELAKKKKKQRVAKSVASSVTGTIGREIGNEIGNTLGGSFGKKIGGNLGASLGRGILSTLFK